MYRILQITNEIDLLLNLIWDFEELNYWKRLSYIEVSLSKKGLKSIRCRK
jgi:hypothetical protein